MLAKRIHIRWTGARSPRVYRTTIEHMTFTDLRTGMLTGERVECAIKTVGDLHDYWLDPGSIGDSDAVLYQTEVFSPVADPGEGIVLWGNTTLMPGRVGDELFMTRGHRHIKKTHGELCITVSGSGLLLLMDADRLTRTEKMEAGSTHWIDGNLAHRTVNTGFEPLLFLCAWPADCGHEYDEIRKSGF